VQTAHHILHDCTKFKPPCHINEVDNPAILEYLTNQSSDQHVFLFMYTKEEEGLVSNWRAKQCVLISISTSKQNAVISTSEQNAVINQMSIACLTACK